MTRSPERAEPSTGSSPVVHVRPWPDADALFRSDPSWLGSDDAYSIPIGDNRTLWLFGDTFIGQGSRADSAIVPNSVAIQSGSDPSRASIRFYWGPGPSAFFREPGPTWLWPAHGALLGSRLLLFFMRVRRVAMPRNFEIVGWSAALVPNPDEPPDRWTITQVASGGGPRAPVAGHAVVVEGGYVYSYAPNAQDLDGFVYGISEDLRLRAHLVRWRSSDASQGLLDRAEYRTLDGWTTTPTDAAVVIPDTPMEFSVHRHAGTGTFLAVQGLRLVGAELALRTAERIEGPWSAPLAVHRPEESDRTDTCLYAFKAHPHLGGCDLVVTYSSNGRTLETTVADESLYYPRFLRLTFAPA